MVVAVVVAMVVVDGQPEKGHCVCCPTGKAPG